MRTFINGLVLAGLAVMTVGCALDRGTTPGTPSGAHADRAGDTKACVMQSGDHAVLRLTVSADATCTPKDGSLHLESHARDAVDVWLAPGANSVDAAAGRVGQAITSEFKDFKATSTTALTIAGAPAKRLMGSGTEADDNDPGHADVIMFTAGGRVFVACTHGESLSAAAQQWMLAVVQTAQAP